jgi:hypothetical protein
MNPQGVRYVKTAEVVVDVATACYGVHSAIKISRETIALAKSTPTGVPLQLGWGSEVTTVKGSAFIIATKFRESRKVISYLNLMNQSFNGSLKLDGAWN